MNLRDFSYIVKIDELKSFTKAAQQLYVSQSALSFQVKKIEEIFEVKIFERGNSSILTTEIGKKIVAKAKKILFEFDEMKDLAKNSQSGFAGDFRLGAFPTLAPYYFPKITRKIVKKYKDLNLFLVEEKTEDLVEKLKDGRLDAAFLAEPIEDSDLEKISIFEEKFLLAKSRKNSDFLSDKKVKMSDLRGKKVMLLEDGHCLRGQALQVCEISGALEDKTYRASSLTTLLEMVRLNAGVTLVPEIAAQKDASINFLSIENPPKRKIALYFRKNNWRKILIKEMVGFLK